MSFRTTCICTVQFVQVYADLSCSTDMDVDGSATTKTKRSKTARAKRNDSNRIQKKRHRKVANRMTFPSVKQRRTVSKVKN